MELYQLIVINNWEKLEKLCKSLCEKANKQSLYEDMFSEVIIDKSLECFEAFDPKRNDDLEGFMLYKFRWLCRSWLSSWHKREERYSQLSVIDEPIAEHEAFSALSARDEVIEILGVLPSLDRRLLLLKIAHGWTFDQIAERLNCPESSVRVKFNQALLKAKWYGEQRKKRSIV